MDQFKKDGGEDDQNGNNSYGASRGNWWEGILKIRRGFQTRLADMTKKLYASLVQVLFIIRTLPQVSRCRIAHLFIRGASLILTSDTALAL